MRLSRGEFSHLVMTLALSGAELRKRYPVKNGVLVVRGRMMGGSRRGMEGALDPGISTHQAQSPC